MKILSNTGVKNSEAEDDGYDQVLRIEANNIVFKIDIHASHWDQYSYATLEVLKKDLEWKVLDRKHPFYDYDITGNYPAAYNIQQNLFEPIINDFKKLIQDEYSIILKLDYYN